MNGSGAVTAGAEHVLADRLRSALGEEAVRTGAVHRFAFANDASHYRLVPQAVVLASDAAAVGRAMSAAAAAGASVTFRSGGTSLSGQASGDGVLIDTRRAFRRIAVEDEGRSVRVEPGATLRAVNARLARFGRALGPDPASEVACTIGGVIANNSSGMAAGIELNSYRTLRSMTVVLASGTVIDTGAADASERLRREEPALASALDALRDRVRANPHAVAEIEARFAMKNTLGYGLNALTDFTEPIDLLARLLIGSEGTLGFVAEAVFETVPIDPCVTTGLFVFESVADATTALPALIGTGAATLELLDATSLRVARRLDDAPPEVSGFEIDRHAALLVEYRAADEAALARAVAEAAPAIAELPLLRAAEFTEDPATRAALWRARKGLYAAVAGARPSGTSALLEDVVVPVVALADACRDLAALLERFGYEDGVIFGHAKDGNLHFMLTDDFSTAGAIDRLERFTEEMADLVLGYGGNLKAEHGTGRAMAPFVARQYSAELVEVMREIKRAFDPSGVLNPGVLLPGDPREHLERMKPVVRVEPEVDRCVECGYCEPACPSKDLTLTPRQRIVVRRARATAEAAGDTELVRELDAAYQTEGIDSCAVDGMCRTACPVGINTGDLVRRLREERASGPEQAAWRTAAGHWGAVTRAAGVGLTAAALAPAPLIGAANRAARAVLGEDRVPLHTPDLPRGGTPRSRIAVPEARAAGTSDAAVVFVPSCQGAMFAPGEPGGTGVQLAFERLCARAGLRIVVPERIDGLCCGTPWSSKGYADGHREMSERVLDAVAAAGAGLPVVVDASSCTEGVAKIMRAAVEAGDPRAATVVDAVGFIAERALPKLPELSDDKKLDSLVLHPTCSSAQLGIDAELRAIAAAAARTVRVPLDWGCCGFAGDRGMLHPELTASATAAEAAEVRALAADAHASCNRACEIAMTRATGSTYLHVLEVLEGRYAALGL